MAIHDQYDDDDDAVTGSRLDAIEAAISNELQRQALAGASRIDIAAMAVAVETAIELFPITVDDGKEPDELNASNDG